MAKNCQPFINQPFMINDVLQIFFFFTIFVFTQYTTNLKENDSNTYSFY